MLNKSPILSVCIPTYNGGNRIKYSLDALILALKGRDDVEVIVSDNSSDDNTQEVLLSYKKEKSVSVYRNNINLGFNGNIKRIVREYAKGSYCWIIGDDDILDYDALEKIIPILEKEEPSYVSIRHRLIKEDEIQTFIIKESRIIDYCIASYFKCLDINASSSNVLGTFMSSQIFLLDRVKEFDLNSLGDNDWKDFRKVFPNSYIMTELFHDDNHCCCITTPVISALVHEKSWDDKLFKIWARILPDYYYYCITCASDKGLLSKTSYIITYKKTLLYLKALLSFQFSIVNWRYIFSFLFLKGLFFVCKEKFGGKN